MIKKTQEFKMNALNYAKNFLDNQHDKDFYTKVLSKDYHNEIKLVTKASFEKYSEICKQTFNFYTNLRDVLVDYISKRIEKNTEELNESSYNLLLNQFFNEYFNGLAMSNVSPKDFPTFLDNNLNNFLIKTLNKLNFNENDNGLYFFNCEIYERNYVNECLNIAFN